MLDIEIQQNLDCMFLIGLDEKKKKKYIQHRKVQITGKG